MMLSLLGCSSGVGAAIGWYIVLKNHWSQLTEISVAMSIQIGAFAQAVLVEFGFLIFRLWGAVESSAK